MTDIPALARQGAVAVAAGRVAIGLTALAFPSVPSRPWVGAGADDLVARVFGRALGARDVALGVGTLTALHRRAADPESASTWIAAGAVSDSLDVVATVASWRELPRVGRWLIVLSAGAAALAGAAGTVAVRAGRTAPPAVTALGSVHPSTATSSWLRRSRSAMMSIPVIFSSP